MQTLVCCIVCCVVSYYVNAFSLSFAIAIDLQNTFVKRRRYKTTLKTEQHTHTDCRATGLKSSNAVDDYKAIPRWGSVLGWSQCVTSNYGRASVRVSV